MTDAPDPKRLEHLDESITKLRHDLEEIDSRVEDDRKFIDDGAASPDSEVDNTIVPPG